jgi:hypothetical protein
MKFNYKTNAPTTSMSLPDRDLVLIPGSTIELSQVEVELPNIQALVEQGLLVAKEEETEEEVEAEEAEEDTEE